MASFLVRPRTCMVGFFYREKKERYVSLLGRFLWSARNRFSIDKPQIERDFNIRFVSRFLLVDLFWPIQRKARVLRVISAVDTNWLKLIAVWNRCFIDRLFPEDRNLTVNPKLSYKDTPQPRFWNREVGIINTPVVIFWCWNWEKEQKIKKKKYFREMKMNEVAV